MKHKSESHAEKGKMGIVWKSAFLVALLAVGSISAIFAGHGVGTGGDHVRATFIRMGDVVVDFLQETPRGQALVAEHLLQIADLKATLDIGVISVQEGILIDNNGSVVDALGVPGKITLSQDRWMAHFENGRDVYFLVFHEMLRAAGINDDNYVISKDLADFPATRKIVTRVATVYPLLGDIPLNKLIAIDRVQLDGDGCPRQLAGTFADFDLEKNILNVALQRYDLTLIGSSAARKSCTIVIPVNPPVGKKLVVTQLDFSAKVIIGAQTNAAIASDATYARSNIAPFTKSFTATEDTQGRLLARSHQAVSSNCKGTGEILRIRTAASLQKGQAANQKVTSVTSNRLIADGIAISFNIETCN